MRKKTPDPKKARAVKPAAVPQDVARPPAFDIPGADLWRAELLAMAAILPAVADVIWADGGQFGLHSQEEVEASFDNMPV